MLLAEATRLPHPFRFLHFLYHSAESGTSEAIPPFDTVTTAPLSVDACYLVRSSVAQSNGRKKAHEARRFV